MSFYFLSNGEVTSSPENRNKPNELNPMLHTMWLFNIKAITIVLPDTFISNRNLSFSVSQIKLESDITAE